jgi:ATP-binding cassette subfamily C (CFTR/MRP) protein 1
MFTVLTNVPTLSVGLTFFFLGIQRGPSGFTVKEVFTALSLLNLLRGPFIFFPIMFANTLQYKVSFERIHSFVSREELPKRDRAKASTTQKVMIRMKNASFKWPTDTETPHLNSLNLKVKRGECCAIVGSVGSGKSTLCQAVLGEIRQVAGTCDVYGSFAYVYITNFPIISSGRNIHIELILGLVLRNHSYAAQDAWIINASVRDNIVFGRPFDMKRYRRVVKASALVTDLAQFPAGDLTEIGEKGVNLSGGMCWLRAAEYVGIF